ncbi:MAG: acetyl-CoA carboxylase biotin carboxyl carrier protein [Nitrospirae bacterium]|nr:acetyl-CoA carboxylase biotin carboxyl carrier protein [Nitrospirota bacterium]
MKDKKPWIDLGYIKELVDFLKDTDISDLEVEKDGVRVRIKKSSNSTSYSLRKIQETVSTNLPSIPVNRGVTAISTEVIDKYHAVRSPIVGTFYRSATPGAESYVNVGDTVKKGQILCIVEAMKLMNEIESEVGGKVVEIMVEDAQPVEYGEALFKIEPA